MQAAQAQAAAGAGGVEEAVSLSDKKPSPADEQEVVDLGKESPEAESATIKEDPPAAPVHGIQVTTTAAAARGT